MYEQIIEKALQLGFTETKLTFGEALEIAAEDLDLHAEDDDDLPEDVTGAATFQEARVMTMNRGVVVRFSDGAEVQVTIVLSARSAHAL